LGKSTGYDYSRCGNPTRDEVQKTVALLEQGMQEGVIRPVRIPILKMMLEASLEQFFQRDILLQNEITYAQALQEVVGILMYGIASER
jgi:cystathionine beta-lyase/cystathionine gamma-synthase